MSRLPVGTSRLGYGCSRIVGPNSAGRAQTLLEAAFDAGIVHFDVARVYGTGDAERVLGRFLADGRPAVVVTKFGIRPMADTPATRALKGALRRTMRHVKPLATLIRRRASVTATRGLFSPDEMLASLTASEEALGAGRISGFLLHDAEPADWQPAELRAALADLVEQGRIGGFGTATEVAETAALLGGDAPWPRIVQVRDDLSDTASRLISELDEADVTIVTFGTLASNLGPMLERCERDADYGRRLAEVLGGPPQRERVAEALLATALTRNRRGTVVFSSERPDRITRAGTVTALPSDVASELTRLARIEPS